MKRIRAVTSTRTTTSQEEHSNNWITIHCRPTYMHSYLVTAFLVYRPDRTVRPTRSRRSKCGTCERGLTTWSRVLLQEETGLQLVKKFAVLYGTHKFISWFTSTGHLSFPEPDQYSQWPTSHFLMIHFNIIFPSTPVSWFRFLFNRCNKLNNADTPLPYTC
jgi:hypothetical protein